MTQTLEELDLTNVYQRAGLEVWRISTPDFQDAVMFMPPVEEPFIVDDISSAPRGGREFFSLKHSDDVGPQMNFDPSMEFEASFGMGYPAEPFKYEDEKWIY